MDTNKREKDNERKSSSDLAIDKFCESARKCNKQTTVRAFNKESSDPRESICVPANEINHRSSDTNDYKMAARQRQEALSSGDDFRLIVLLRSDADRHNIEEIRGSWGSPKYGKHIPLIYDREETMHWHKW